MRGLRVAFQGRLFRDAEIKVSKAGNSYLSFSCPIEMGEKKPGEQYAPSEWARVLHVAPKDSPEDYIAELATRLVRNTECYVEGTLETRAYLDTKTNLPKCGLQVFGWKCEPMGTFRRRSARQDDDRPASGPQQGLSMPPDDPTEPIKTTPGGAGRVDGGFSDDDVPFRRRENW